MSKPDGTLILSATLPLLAGRYRYVRCIGTGAPRSSPPPRSPAPPHAHARPASAGGFSQILICDDTYAVDSDNQRREGCDSLVAIKVMNQKYKDIGAQVRRPSLRPRPGERRRPLGPCLLGRHACLLPGLRRSWSCCGT